MVSDIVLILNHSDHSTIRALTRTISDGSSLYYICSDMLEIHTK